MNDLLYRYFGGSLSDSEKQSLFAAMEKDEALKNEFVKLQNNYALAQMLGHKDDQEFAERSLQALQLKRTLKKTVYRRMRRFSAYAAAVLILIGCFFIYRYVQLTQQPTVEVVQYEAAAGLRKDILLSDGTKIRLAPGSKIRIPMSFTGNERPVQLDGEALFEVVSNKEKPFIVKTGRYNVQVLGTVFVVNAYAKNTTFKTSLMKGSVKVYSTHEQLHLNPGECALSKGEGLKKTKNANNDIGFLENGIYQFEEESLQTIVNKLNDWYGGQVQITDPKLAEVSLSGKFRESDDVETLIKVIRKIHPFRYRKLMDNRIEIY